MGQVFGNVLARGIGSMINTGQTQPGGQQPNHQQYYQQMRESMKSMDESLKQLEQLQMPGGQYQAGGYQPGGGSGKNKGVGVTPGLPPQTMQPMPAVLPDDFRNFEDPNNRQFLDVADFSRPSTFGD